MLILRPEPWCRAIVLHLSSILVVIRRVTRRRHCCARTEGHRRGHHRAPGLRDEELAEETLASAFRFEYPRYEIIFCAAHAGDDAIPLVRRLIAAHPEVPARLLVGNDHISNNPKLNNT